MFHVCWNLLTRFFGFWSRPPADTINSFEDVLKNEDIKLVVVRGSSWTSLLKSSAPGTAKAEVFRELCCPL